MDDNRITAYTFTRIQPQASDNDLLTAQREMDTYNASLAYGISLLQMLLDMDLITENEYERIVRISAEYYDTDVVCV